MARDLGAELAFGGNLRKSRGKLSEGKVEVHPCRRLGRWRIIGWEWDEKANMEDRGARQETQALCH